MDWLLNFLFVALMITALMLAAYVVVHRFFPGWGTKLVNILVALPVFAASLLEPLAGLPWQDIVPADTAKAILFAITLANMFMKIIHDARAKKADV